jgi:hypothetical protein
VRGLSVFTLGSSVLEYPKHSQAHGVGAKTDQEKLLSIETPITQQLCLAGYSRIRHFAFLGKLPSRCLLRPTADDNRYCPG